MKRIIEFFSENKKLTAILFAFILVGAFLSGAYFWFSENGGITLMPQKVSVVIDAGHGGEDGGAVSISGIKESTINLSVALRLDQLLTFCGYQTKMIRTTDDSVYTQGNSLSEKKVSDLRQRVAMIAQASPAILLSIHQNHFSVPK